MSILRHLIPRVEAGGWTGAALTSRPGGGAEIPAGRWRNWLIATGRPTTTPVRDSVNGGIITIQWLGLMVEIGVGRVR
ncbi:hypothetical protein CA236_01350 [Sphingomonas sp. ABOLG]|uniref:hypothetical protein n=1 Tax=Sphingomonas sp. ABOLG TaxID=1985880 RepID=UPI000F7D7ACD|nr:hypothetical protein [Sphingomonas sp. ABOLG]RSV20569.1 hypothetical protein CA236_01350 [Sphingomonas sp. ABOLG]